MTGEQTAAAKMPGGLTHSSVTLSGPYAFSRIGAVEVPKHTAPLKRCRIQACLFVVQARERSSPGHGAALRDVTAKRSDDFVYQQTWKPT